MLTRSVRDSAHYLAAAERFHTHPGLRPVGLVEGPANRRLRVGVIARDAFGRPVHADINAAARSRLRKEGGCDAEAVYVRSGNASNSWRRADRLQTLVELVSHLDRAVHAVVMRDDVAVGVEDVETALG